MPTHSTTRMCTVVLLVTACCLLTGCAEAEAKRQQREIAHQKALADVEIEKKRREMELELEQKVRERKQAEDKERRQKEEAEAQERKIRTKAAAETARLSNQQRQGVEAIEVGFRRSIADESTMVLVLKNLKTYSLDFDLKCYTTNGRSKTIFVSIPAREATEIGFLEGWSGNWVTGERCEAYLDGKRLWSVTAP